jgi:PucR family transcriptional regulator, purine catabolism regulatory protein
VQAGEGPFSVLYTLENVAITMGDLLQLRHLNLRVVAGEAGLDRPIRWVHTSELQDPTPWLSGGELLLTTGMGLQGSQGAQRTFVRKLVDAGLAGLGFGVGFGFDEVPGPIRRAAERASFPIIEVPYPVPFIAIAEAVSSHIAEERIREAQTSIEIHERLASLVSTGAGPADVLDEVTELAGGWAVLFDMRGNVVARSATSGAPAPDPARVWKGLPRGLVERRGPLTSSDVTPHGTLVAMAVVAGKRHEGVLVYGSPRRLDPRTRFVVRHAVTVLGLLLASRRAVVEAERRVAGDILSEAFSGRLTGTDLKRRLELVGFSSGESLIAIAVESGAGAAGALDDLAWAFDGAIGTRARAARTTTMGGRVAGIALHDNPEDLAREVLKELTAAAPELRLDPSTLRIGVGESVEPQRIRDSYLSAVLALRAAASHRRIASPTDLGSYALLLGAQPRPVLEGFVRSVLGPLLERDRQKSSELVASVRAFIESGGRWEPGADALGVHRHTLRYRVRQAEDLLGRDLSSAEDRLELWLALKAAELLEE